MPDQQPDPQGQPANTTDQAATQALADTGNGQPSGPFFEYVGPDGKKEVYQNKDELAKAFGGSYLRQSDYTRKTQEIAKRAKDFDDRDKKFQEDQKSFVQNRQRYDRWDEILKTRPDVYQQLERIASSPADASTAFDRAKEYGDGIKTELEKRLETLEKQIEEERTKKEVADTISELKVKYPDLDEGELMTRLEYLGDGNTGKLMELLYWATKGQKSPAAIEEKITESLKKKSQANLTSTKGVGGPTSPKVFKTTDEAKNAAYEAEGLAPGL